MTPPSPTPDYLPPPSPPSDPHALLTHYLFTARQSLSSVSFCSRANSLVTSARRSLSSSFSLSARIVFVAAALRDQLKVSRDVYQAFRSVEGDCRRRFQETLGRLDEADRKLNLVLEGLKGVRLESCFGEEGRRLVDFVDAEGVEGLKSGLRGCIDQVQESHEAFLKTIEELETDITSFEARLKPLSIPVPSPSDNPLTTLITTLEDHALSMSALMNSLNDHYDQCKAALLSLDSPSSPTTTTDLLTVLAKDSLEVPDVIDEMKERLSTMEDLVSSSLEPQMQSLESTDELMLQAFLAFERFQEKLALYLAAMTDFECKQDDSFTRMSEKLEEMIALEEFYTGFGGAYEAMVAEVRRREDRVEEMRKVAREAEARIARIAEEDRREREIFRERQGEYLPADIWPGLMEGPPRFEIVEVEGEMGSSNEGDEEAGMVGTVRNGMEQMGL